MPNLTTALPRRTGDLQKDYDNLYDTCVSLIDELKSILCNLDSGNVTEAASIKAQNIDVSQAKIKDAQVQSMTADKLTAGTIDARDINVIHITADNIDTGTLNSGLVTIRNTDGDGSYMAMADNTIVLNQKNLDGTYTPRVLIGRVQDDNGYRYVFNVQNSDGSQRIHMNDAGNIFITGNLSGASTISVETTATVGQSLVLQDRGVAGTGWEQAASMGVNTGTLRITANNNREIELNTDSNIKARCNSFTINGKRVLTVDDLS